MCANKWEKIKINFNVYTIKKQLYLPVVKYKYFNSPDCKTKNIGGEL